MVRKQQLQIKGTMSIHVAFFLQESRLTTEEGRQESNDAEHFEGFLGCELNCEKL